MDGEYRALVEKISGFTAALEKTLAQDMVCRAGCDGCCQVWLAPSQVEADALRNALASMSVEARTRIAERGRRELAREATAGSSPRCALLDDDGRCEAYDARPLVCRTQGHALRYPAGVIPESAIRKRLPQGEVTACSLNFERAMPSAEHSIDAERIDQLLALINRRYCDAKGLDPLARHPISRLAAECDVLACDPA